MSGRRYPAQDSPQGRSPKPAWQKVAAAVGLGAVLAACGGRDEQPIEAEILNVREADLLGPYPSTPEEGVTRTFEYPRGSGKTVDVNIKAAYYGIPQDRFFEDGTIHFSTCATATVVGGDSDVEVVTPHPRFQSVDVDYPRIDFGLWEWEIGFLGGEVIASDETSQLAEGAGPGAAVRPTNCTEPRPVVNGARFLASDVQLLVSTGNTGEFHRLGREPLESLPTIFEDDAGIPLRVAHLPSEPEPRSSGRELGLSLVPDL